MNSISVAKILSYLRSFFISKVSVIDLKSFSSDLHQEQNLSKFKLALDFVNKIKSEELHPGCYVNSKYAHKSKNDTFVKMLLGYKLHNHLNPKYGDYIFNVINLSPERAPKTYLDKNRSISILVPTYGSYEDVKVCLESIIGAKTDVRWTLTVIDDASPNFEDRLKIRKLCELNNVNFIQHETNLGYVSTVNEFFNLVSDDVLILNSDTEVYDYWLEAFVSVLDENTGSVTTLSNNASIFSFQTNKDWNQKTIREFAKSMSLTLNEMWLDPIEIPTSHGFCMLVTRAAIELVGDLDEATFGHGYGEENDFSFRLSQHGLVNALTPRTFVYHRGSASFGESNFQRKKMAEKVLLQKWPSYPRIVKKFLKDDPIRRIELRARRHQALNPRKMVTIQISHGRGGGTDVALRNEIKNTLNPDYINYWISPSLYPGCIKLSVVDQGGEILLHDSIGFGSKILAENLKKLNIKKLVLHHTDGFDSEFLTDLVKKLNIPFEYRIHDYFTVCPFFHFVTESGEYCGQPDETSCNKCISSRSEAGITIQNWRSEKGQLLFHANSITAPNSDVVANLNKYHPNLKIEERTPESNLSTKHLETNLKKTIVVIGAFSSIKGADNLLEIIEAASNDFNFYLVGSLLEIKYPELYQNLLKSKKLVVLGNYQNDDVALNLINRLNPVAFLFPGKIPETYSYTLDIALKFEKPIVACEIGAFACRIPPEFFIKFDTSSTPSQISSLIEISFKNLPNRSG